MIWTAKSKLVTKSPLDQIPNLTPLPGAQMQIGVEMKRAALQPGAQR